jgi:hypothetical protein
MDIKHRTSHSLKVINNTCSFNLRTHILEAINQTNQIMKRFTKLYALLLVMYLTQLLSGLMYCQSVNLIDKDKILKFDAVKKNRNYYFSNGKKLTITDLDSNTKIEICGSSSRFEFSTTRKNNDLTIVSNGNSYEIKCNEISNLLFSSFLSIKIGGNDFNFGNQYISPTKDYKLKPGNTVRTYTYNNGDIYDIVKNKYNRFINSSCIFTKLNEFIIGKDNSRYVRILVVSFSNDSKLDPIFLSQKQPTDKSDNTYWVLETDVNDSKIFPLN